MNKIYGIGLSRTGTTSLTHAMWENGCNMIHYPQFSNLFDPKNEGASDLPAAIYFKELDKKFPDSKFIYTIRDKESWIKSMENHFTKHVSVNSWLKENRIKMYGSIDFNKELCLQAYDSHDQNVREYFQNREDFLIINICGGEGWRKLSAFLNIQADTTLEFPHKRKTG
jgi:hypothetical protein